MKEGAELVQTSKGFKIPECVAFGKAVLGDYLYFNDNKRLMRYNLKTSPVIKKAWRANGV